MNYKEEAYRRIDMVRNPAMDVVRIVACFFVVSIHFFLYSGFYAETISSGRMYVAVCMRVVFMCCVPLFITLSGYLMCNKKLNAKYYTRIGKTYFVYFVASLFCMLIYPKMYGAFRILLGLPAQSFSPLSFGDVIRGILGFTGAPYAWYIEMYLGLFLLIPFLNILYEHIESRNQKRLLLYTCILLTALPSVLNVYCFSAGPMWWRNPTMHDESGALFEAEQIFPAYWMLTFPITYYYIGCYLKEYGLKLKTWKNLLLIVVMTIISGIYNIWRSKGTVFQHGAWGEHQSLFCVILTVLIFSFFMNLKYDHISNCFKRFLSKVSALCLGIYLVSWCFDQLFYPILLKRVPVMGYRLKYYFVIVPAVFICSAIVSAIILKLYEITLWIAKNLWGLRKKNKNL